jgi:hypothetical protein
MPETAVFIVPKILNLQLLYIAGSQLVAGPCMKLFVPSQIGDAASRHSDSVAVTCEVRAHEE